MAEIAREVGRAPSTLHGWAAAGGWRLAEIEVFSLAPLQGEREEGDSPRVRGCGAAADDPLTSILSPSEGERRNDAAPLSPLEAARALHQKSADLASAGQVRAAEAAARLADRILRTEYHLTRIGGPPEKSEAERAQETEALRAEIGRRFDRLRAAKAAQEGGG